MTLRKTADVCTDDCEIGTYIDDGVIGGDVVVWIHVSAAGNGGSVGDAGRRKCCDGNTDSDRRIALSGGQRIGARAGERCERAGPVGS